MCVKNEYEWHMIKVVWIVGLFMLAIGTSRDDCK